MTADNESFKKVLLVEDDRSHRDFISLILENMEFTVVTAFDGEDAIKKIKEENFDIILMDIELPKINGLEAALVIRDMKRHKDIPNIPILAITSSQDEETKQNCLNAGMDGVIPKSLWKPKWEPAIKKQISDVLNKSNVELK